MTSELLTRLVSVARVTSLTSLDAASHASATSGSSRRSNRTHVLAFITAALIGSSRLPSLRMRTVSKWSIRSPRVSRQSLNNRSFFVTMIRGNNQHDVLANRLFRGVPEQAFCALIPTGDYAIQIFAHNRIARRFRNGGRQTANGSPALLACVRSRQ
jgi:hypothetical protein